MRQQEVKRKIKEHFFVYPNDKLRIREIERKLGLALPSVIRYCKELEKEGFLRIIKIGNVSFYSSNKQNKLYVLEKKLFNIYRLYKSGFVDYLRRELSDPLIIVFGSFSRGEDDENSDVDIYIETFSKKEIKVYKFEKKLNRKIQIFRHKSLNEIKNKHLANNIINGVTLNGFLEVVK